MKNRIPLNPSLLAVVPATDYAMHSVGRTAVSWDPFGPGWESEPDDGRPASEPCPDTDDTDVESWAALLEDAWREAIAAQASGLLCAPPVAGDAELYRRYHRARGLAELLDEVDERLAVERVTDRARTAVVSGVSA
uniref:hypothetical protein n=1 Tax=Saccharothrix espanaensis TaxID=103731 RepID=UPI003F49700C